MKRRKNLFFGDDLNNLGDLFLLFQNLELVSEEDTIVLVRQHGPIAPQIRKRLEDRGVHLINSKSVSRFMAACWRSNVVIGGGQMVRDNVSLRGLVILVFGLVLARLSGGRVTTRGIGVSPIRKLQVKALWRRVLRLCDRVVVRDATSLANASQLVANLKIELAADMGFYPSKQNERLRNAADVIPSDSACIIIAPCVDEERVMGGPALGELIEALRRAFPRSEMVVLCHDIREEMDKRAASMIMGQCSLSDARVVAPHDLDTVFSYYEQARFVVTNRLHSAIFSLLSGRPLLIWMDGSEKLENVCADFSIPSVKTEESAEKIKELMAASLSFNRSYREAALREKVELSRKNVR